MIGIVSLGNVPARPLSPVRVPNAVSRPCAAHDHHRWTDGPGSALLYAPRPLRRRQGEAPTEDQQPAVPPEAVSTLSCD